MAEGLNRVLLVGNLGADPELRFTQAGQAVLNLRLATTEAFLGKDQQWQERTDWHNVVVWGKRAEALARLLKKGAQLVVEGGLRTSSCEDRAGTKHHKTEVHATNVVLLGAKRDDRLGGEIAPRTTAHTRRETPRTRQEPRPESEAAVAFGSGDSDEIPF
jgi:single-strand DNA-binding protein